MTEKAQRICPSPASGNVTVKDGFALAALAAAAGRPASEVAAVAGVTERTIRRWNRKPSFQAMVSRLRDSMLSDAMGRLLSANADAVEALKALLASPSDQARLGAAVNLLRLTLQARKELKLEKEVEELHDRLDKIKTEKSGD